MTTPSYSIVIPVYRRVFGFREALASALEVDGCQEVLVLDDHSDHDEFERIAQSFCSDKVRYLRNDENIGLFGNWNRGAQLAQGEFVSILCSDDIISPNAYRLFADAYRSDPGLDVFFGSFCTFNDSIAQAFTERAFAPGPMNSLDLIATAVEKGAAFPVLTIARRAKVLERPFVAKPHSGNDWLWIFGNATAFRLHAVDQPISYWRRHPDQDAVVSQTVTTDCWPLMYSLMAQQLQAQGHPMAPRALRRAKGVVLSWLLNDFIARRDMYPRLRSAEAAQHPFLQVALALAEKDWLLGRLLNADSGDRLCYNLGRLYRKSGLYPAS